MSATSLLTRRRLLLGVIVLVLAVAAVVAVIALRSDADPTAGNTPSTSPTASSGTDAGSDPEVSESGAGDDEQPGDAPSDDLAGDDPTDAEPGGAAEPAARETLDPVPFGDEVTPQRGVTVAVPKVEEVTGEANTPGEVGGPALRFTVDVTNGTGKTLDLRTVVVNAYYGPDRTPASPLLKPGGKAFESEVGDGDTARGVFVFNVPAEFQDKVELEIDPRIDAPIAIFTGA
ncbi:hypothetical protein ACFO6V_11205 [Promicromonospora alba]|uniref:DUF4352 domain-containing protein n=1 Tax=Promicromonospora alba TaxID=1616110 RepID=A0ABV9HHP1_9MICO